MSPPDPALQGLQLDDHPRLIDAAPISLIDGLGGAYDPERRRPGILQWVVEDETGVPAHVAGAKQLGDVSRLTTSIPVNASAGSKLGV